LWEQNEQIENKHKQGTSTTADLSNQKPQDEVFESKPSTASSDKEKLAQASQRLDCKPRDSLERREKSFLKKEK
jgi:hypothetical protein